MTVCLPGGSDGGPGNDVCSPETWLINHYAIMLKCIYSLCFFVVGHGCILPKAATENTEVANLTIQYQYRMHDGTFGSIPPYQYELVKIGNRSFLRTDYPFSRSYSNFDGTRSEDLPADTAWMQAMWFVIDSFSGRAMVYDSMQAERDNNRPEPFYLVNSDSVKKENPFFGKKIDNKTLRCVPIGSAIEYGTAPNDTLMCRFNVFDSTGKKEPPIFTFKWCRGKGWPEFDYYPRLKPAGNYYVASFEEKFAAKGNRAVIDESGADSVYLSFSARYNVLPSRDLNFFKMLSSKYDSLVAIEAATSPQKR